MNEYIDHRNFELWNLLSENYNISIENSPNNEYSCFIQNSIAIIYIVPTNISRNSFMHELLHIYLKYKEFYLGSSIKNFIRQDNVLSKMLSEKLLEHIGNCLDHTKTFQIYCDLGFKEEEFQIDFETFKCNKEDLNNLKMHFNLLGNNNATVIDSYIGKLISMLCDPNKNNVYFKELYEFETLDSELYKIIHKLVNDTKNFDIEKNNFLYSYRDISIDFYENLKKWSHNKNTNKKNF